ncbi:MAG: hypothetical protein ACFFCQ_15070 [Promethearchaeota archaeon]
MTNLTFNSYIESCSISVISTFYIDSIATYYIFSVPDLREELINAGTFVSAEIDSNLLSGLNLSTDSYIKTAELTVLVNFSF